MKNIFSRLEGNPIKTLRKLSSFVDQLLVSGGNFLTIAICAHALPLSEQGKLTYAIASYMAILMVNVTGIFQGAAVRAPSQESSYKISMARLQLIQAGALSLLVSALWGGFGNVFGWQATLTEIVLLFVYLTIQQLADFDRRSAYIFNNSERAVSSSLALYPWRIAALLYLKPGTLVEVIQVLIISAIIPALPTIVTAMRRRSSANQSWLKVVAEQFNYSRMFLAGAPLTWLLGYLPIFMLGVIQGKEQAGILASIRGLSNIANIFMEQIETKVVADWARMRHGEGDHVMEVAIINLLKLGAIFWTVGFILVLVFGQEIVNFFLGKIYTPFWDLLVIGWISYGVYFLSRVYGIKHRTLGSNKIEFIGVSFGVMAGVMFGYVFIPAFNEAGAAWVYVAIFLVVLICQMIYTKLVTDNTN